MPDDIRALKALEVIQEQTEELLDVVDRVRVDLDYRTARERLGRWKSRTIEVLSEHVHPDEGGRLREKRKYGVLKGHPLRDIEDEVHMYLSFLQALADEVKQHPSSIMGQDNACEGVSTALSDETRKPGQESVPGAVTGSEMVPSSLVGLLRGDLRGKVCVFIGAGASTSAGIPCGTAFRNKILSAVYRANLDQQSLEDRFRQEFSLKDPDGQLTLEMILSHLKDRYGDVALSVVQSQVDDDKEPPPGYISLACLMHEGFFRVAFTVNFDELIERALDMEMGSTGYERMCETDGFRSSTPDLNPNIPLLIKLHGTFTLVSTLRAAWEDVQNLLPEKAKFLEHYATYCPLLFVGYSGRDPDIRSCLNISSQRSGNTIFWVSPNDLEEQAREVLVWYGSTSNHIQMEADTFFGKLEHLLCSRGIDYRAHVRGMGWLGWVSDGEIARTTGERKRLEAFEIRLRPIMPHGSGVRYKAYVRGEGWQDWVSSDETAGTTGQGAPVQAIRIELTGVPPGYCIVYQAHVAQLGWMELKANGEVAGCVEDGKRIEAIRIRVIVPGYEGGHCA
jgi:NAD-dependent SIR2 family protein deacetylase